ncbi:MAG: AgmX/PglI C-terminal domain-containing protein [Deltaproteobacteria bacterium]
MNASALLVTLALVAAEPPAEEVMTKEQAMEKVRSTLNATGPAIDACNARYHNENPKTQGVATVVVKVGESGAVTKTRIDTSLEGARHLRLCLESVAKRWKFPRPNKVDQEFSLKIPVGVEGKFYIPGPGEKPKEPEAKKPDGFIMFQPNFSFRGPKE